MHGGSEMKSKQKPEKKKPEKMPDILPIFPLYDVVLFPKMVLPLIVLQKESIQLIDEAMSSNRIIGTVASRSSEPKAEYLPTDLYQYRLQRRDPENGQSGGRQGPAFAPGTGKI